jgi:hypothetical protein
MIRHIVMWRVSGDSAEERTSRRQQVKSAFEGLRGRIPGMTHLEVGLDTSGADYACDVVLFSEFASKEALDSYATHPEHLRIRDELHGVRSTRHQVDYLVE